MIERKDYLKAKQIVMEYESNPLNISVVMNSLPQYICIEGTEMRYDIEEDEYYRDAGCWSLKYKYIDDRLVSDCDDIPWLHEKELKEISVDEWRKGNEGYV